MALLKDLIVYGASRFIGDVLGSQIYGNGFHHNAHDTDTYFLLAGGGAKALSTIATNDHNHNGSTARTAWGQQYVNASGTLTSISGNMSSVGNIIPSGNNAQNIGSTTNRWAKLYIGTADSYGSATKGIYWDAGVPKACTVAINSGTTNKIAYYSDNTTISSWTSTTGGTVQPIYLNAGVPTALSGSVGGAATPVYLNAGTITKLTGTRGGNKQPVWLNGGEIVASSGSEGSGTQFVYLSSGVITKTTSTVGSSTKPIYLNAGVITECSNMATSSHTHKIKLGGTEITVPAPGTTPTATTLITGPFAINTEANSSKAFSIQRGSSSEGVQHWVDDSEYHIDYTNDEKSSSIHWRIINTDTENPSTPLQTTDFHVYLDSSGNFRPGTTNTGSIGTASYKWKYIYGTNIYGNLTGNVTGNVTGNSGTSDKIKTVTDSTNANYYLTFVDSNNSTATYESLYTNAGIIFNPNKHSFAQGVTVTASGYCSHAEGSSTKASGDTSHAEGYLSEAQGQFSHAEGQNVRAKNTCSHAEGVNTEAGPYAHAEGSSTKASGDTSHAEGYLSEAQGQFSHAEGSTNIASGWCSHVGGNGSTSSGDQSFAHGNNTIASGWASFAINANTTASGLCSFVCGQDTQALHNYEAAFGKFNKSNSNTIFSVGIGTDNDHRANAFEVTVNGLIKGYAGFYHCGIQSNNYVLTGAGGYKKWAEGYEVSTIVARNASGQIYCSHLNTTSNNMDSTAFTKVFVSDDNWIRYVTKAKFVEALREEDTVSFDKSLIVTEAWMDTGIVVNTTNFPKGSGTYAIQISHANLTTPGTNGYASLYSGIISIYTDGTNSTTDSEEIILHRAGHAWVNRIYIRTMPVAATGNCKIQIAASKTWTAASNVTFKFRKLI